MQDKLIKFLTWANGKKAELILMISDIVITTQSDKSRWDERRINTQFNSEFLSNFIKNENHRPDNNSNAKRVIEYIQNNPDFDSLRKLALEVLKMGTPLSELHVLRRQTIKKNGIPIYLEIDDSSKSFKLTEKAIKEFSLDKKDKLLETTKLDYIKNLEIDLIREIQQTDDYFEDKEEVYKHFENVLPERKTYHQYGEKGRVPQDTSENLSTFLLFTYHNEFVGGCYTKGAPLKSEDENGDTYYAYSLFHAVLWFNKSVPKENMENDIIKKEIRGKQNFRNDTFENYKQIVNKLIDLGYLKEEDVILIETEGETEMEVKGNNLHQPINLILYGPPGTGKTYNTVNRALEIIGENISDKTRKEIKALFDVKVKEGQIVFTTFHQSMSYEDFIEGIKPEMNNQNLRYDVKPGIFKKICENARTENNFDDAYEKAVNLVAETGLELKTPQQNKPFSVFINSAKSFVAKPKTEVETPMTITKEMVRNYLENGIVKDWKPYLIPISEYINKNYGPIKFGKKNYVLIIDEINRGNISQIFGELITLIEEDKRVGKDEALEIVLPYSKGKFSVPSNLYIIGTMNTADRSVEALDTALRRRFSFKEMPPKPKLIATEGKLKNKDGVVDGVDLPELLRMMNLRIEKLLDRDHNIGHSYFMSVENLEGLKKVFQNSIIPLLQEYFFGDYGKIGLVLGKGFFENFEPENNTIFADFDYDNASDFEQRKIFRLKNCSDMNDSEFINALAFLLG